MDYKIKFRRKYRLFSAELNVFDTHEYLINLKKDNGTNFDKYFEEYKEMFPLSQY